VDHPPSTASSPRPARRALLTGVAALGAIAAPVGLVAAVAGEEPSGALGTRSALSAEVRSQDATEAVRFDPVRADSGAEAVLSIPAALAGLVAPAGVAAQAAVPATPAVVAAPAPAPTTTTTRPAPAPAPAPAAAPAPAPAPSGGADPNSDATWDRLAQCESGGNWATNTGNGYYGGLQFSASTWRSVGGTGLPHEHSRATQIEMGKRLQARAGWGQWPSCTRRLGYR
jgi:hypothetical protein